MLRATGDIQDCSSMSHRARTDDASKTDLFQILRPQDHERVERGKASVWDRAFPQQPHHPNRPHTTPFIPHRQLAKTTPLKSSHSPRRLTPTTPSSSLPRYISNAYSPIGDTSTITHVSTQNLPPNANDIHEDTQHDIDISLSQQRSSKPQHPHPHVNVDSREHVEVQACLLAYKHRIDVDHLQEMRDQLICEVESMKSKQMLRRGGLLDDGSLMETTKRKTLYLLRHFFALDQTNQITNAPTKPDNLLCDVIDEWYCRDSATADEVGVVWQSIIAHIERTYVLRRQLVPQSDPDPLSITIAMDCLKRLPTKLPEYHRVLNVIITLVESGLYVSTTSESNHRFYFQLVNELRNSMEQDHSSRERLALEVSKTTSHHLATPRQQILATLDILDTQPNSADEKQALLGAFLQRDMPTLAATATDLVLQYYFSSTQNPRSSTQIPEKHKFLSILCGQLNKEDVRLVLHEFTQTHVQAFQLFLQENLDDMDKLIIEGSVATSNRHASIGSIQVNGSSDNQLMLFQMLVERHPTQFARILWQSPYLTAHVFQDSESLIIRILEQNIFLVSQVLQHRSDVLLSLLNHTLRDNTTVLEEFLSNHPRAFNDILVNRSSAVATIVKANPSILSELVHACRPILARVLLATPELLCQLLKTNPDLLSQTIREDMTLLPLAFSLVPQCLCDALERHPEYFLDIAHRKPQLIAKLFTKHPDLLLEPLEANPTVFSSFLVYHRKLLPDFTDPNFNPEYFQFERKTYLDASQQTDNTLGTRPLRIREKIKIQEDLNTLTIRKAQSHCVRPLSVTTGSDKGGKSTTTTISSNSIPSFSFILTEITRLYIKKIQVDAEDDGKQLERKSLPDFILDTYIFEVGYKRQAQSNVTSLLLGAQQCDQESLRMKWFLRFMNVTPSINTNHLPMYHPSAFDFYLLALQFLIPMDELAAHQVEDELLHPLVVPLGKVKEFLEHPIVSAKILPTKELQNALLMTIYDKENLIHGNLSSSSQSIDLTQRGHSFSASFSLHVDDVLESIMIVWYQYQERVREEWTVLFQCANPDGSGVIRYSVFAEMIRAKWMKADDRVIMKIYQSCGEENELGEYSLLVDDFSMEMSIAQEREALRLYSMQS